MYYITGKIDKLLQQNLPACVYIVEQASSLQLKESGKAGRWEGGVMELPIIQQSCIPINTPP